jgi:hypothetical protein
MHSRRKRELLKLFYVFALAFTVRALFAAYFFWQGGDSPDYLNLAESIRHGAFELNGTPTAFRPPLYPLFLAFTPDAIIFQCVLGSLTCAILYKMSKWGSVLYIFAPFTLYYTSAIMNETLFTFLIVLAIYVWGKEKLVFAGIVFGLAALTRPIVFPMLGLGLIICLSPAFRGHWKALAALLGVAVLVCLPWIIRNTLVEGRLTLTQRSALGTNLLYGTFTREEFGKDIWTEAIKRYPNDHQDRDKEYLKEGLSRLNLRARIEQYPRLFIDTGDWFTNNWSLRLGWVLVQLILASLAIFGLAGQPLRYWLLPLFLVLFHIPLWIETRYFLPAIPFVCIFIADGVKRVLHLIQTRILSRGAFSLPRLWVRQ